MSKSTNGRKCWSARAQRRHLMRHHSEINDKVSTEGFYLKAVAQLSQPTYHHFPPRSANVPTSHGDCHIPSRANQPTRGIPTKLLHRIDFRARTPSTQARRTQLIEWKAWWWCFLFRQVCEYNDQEEAARCRLEAKEEKTTISRIPGMTRQVEEVDCSIQYLLVVRVPVKYYIHVFTVSCTVLRVRTLVRRQTVRGSTSTYVYRRTQRPLILDRSHSPSQERTIHSPCWTWKKSPEGRGQEGLESS